MKKLIKNFISKFSKNSKSASKALHLINKIKQNISRERQKELYHLKDVAVPKEIFSEKKVLNGPFEKMIYPDFFSAGSTLYPKLIGSYEFELHQLINHILTSNYEQYIDVGCAEGYYAVGFALKSPGALIHAFDINESAIKYCRQMAEVNNVGDRLFTYSYCDAEKLSSFNFLKKTCILIDCEGYEKMLFN